MRWPAPTDGYKKRFAFLPVKIGGNMIWFEWYYSQFCGTHFSVITVEQYESGDFNEH